jgi:putative transferase (TIGR04331 family)
MPKSFIEEFAYKSSFTESYINKNNNLRYIINENLNEDNMFLIAHAQLHNIKSIYSEHNYLQHQFIGNLIKFITNKFDIFLTLGWKSKNQKLKSAGSLFFLGTEQRKEKKIQYPILFVDGVTAHREPFTSSAYGETGTFNSLNYVKMNIVFFNTLKKFILKKIWVKEYPEKFKSFFCYNSINKEIHKSKIFFTNKIKDSNSNLDECIASAGLIVTNYLSTSYIQALISNKPTIIFFNSKSYFLKEKYQNFYKELIKSKIMYSNPEHAATFINNNFNNLNNWWFDPLTQKARRNFINNNIKKPHNMQNVLNEILKKH